MTQSAELTNFYNMYLEWLNLGAPEGKPFYRRDGLCACVDSYFSEAATHEMKAQFVAKKLDRTLPFNEMMRDFWDEQDRNAIHLNPKRILWIHNHAKP